MKVMGTDGKEYTMESESDLEGAKLINVNLEYDSLSEDNLMDAYYVYCSLSSLVYAFSL